MSDKATAPGAPGSAPGAAIEGGSYEVIRARLQGHGKVLGEAARALNEQRQETFGGSELAVLGTERIRTENNCVPQDMVALSGGLLFGYNVFLGLKKTTSVGDVLSFVRLEEEDGVLHFRPDQPAAFLQDANFVREFGELYQYYAAARLQQLRISGGKLLAVFQTGERAEDVRVFRWAVDGPEPTYVDNRGERDHSFPPTHDFTWTATSRDGHILGRHPHVNVLDEVFVETVGGDLTIKVEDNTDDGEGIYSEPVDDPNQSLDDAEIRYARLGALILLKIRPYQENADRYLVFNSRTKHVVRIDAIGDACVQLPEDHGIVFPGGYYLQTGDWKVFGQGDGELLFERRIPAPNGEDVLYVFYRVRDGAYVLLPYNLIRKEVATPVRCHGYSLFEDGRLVIFRAERDEPSRVHPAQVWATPYVSREFHANAPSDGSLLGRIGNADLVRGISDCLTVARLVAEQSPTRQVYEALVTSVDRVNDSYYWLAEDELGGLADLLAEVRATAELVIDEFEKVQVLQRRAKDTIKEATLKQRALVNALDVQNWRTIDRFMEAMTALHHQRGHLITLREVRYIDRDKLAAFEEQISSHFEVVSRAAVEFLLGDDALVPLTERIDALDGSIGQAQKITQFEPLDAEQQALTEGLNVMVEVVSGLQVDDTTARAEILRKLTDVFGHLNRVRATLVAARTEIGVSEARDDFAAQWGLLGQAVQSALGLADTPEACDEQLGRLMLQLEELEARFGEFDEFVPQLTSKREEIYEAFGTRKQQLQEDRQRRAAAQVAAAERILEALARRAGTFSEEDELNAWFAGDAMVLKLRQISDRLDQLGEGVKAEELRGRLQAARQEALRGLRDKRDLYEDGDVIRLGKHRFPVNTQPLELTMLPIEGEMRLQLSGTDFRETLQDAAVDALKDFWEQALVSEDATVYRAEYLAATILFEAEAGTASSIAELESAALLEDELQALVTERAAARYEEGYERGVHDHDAARILSRLLSLRRGAGLLRFPAPARALACLYWAFGAEDGLRSRVHRRARSLHQLRSSLASNGPLLALGAELGRGIAAWAKDAGVSFGEADLGGAYLVEELAAEHPRFALSGEASSLRDALSAHLADQGGVSLDDDLRALEAQPLEAVELAHAWISAVAQGRDLGDSEGAALECAASLVCEHRLEFDVSGSLTGDTLEGVLGLHPRIRAGRLELRLDEFLGRMTRFAVERAPAWRRWRQVRHDVLTKQRSRLRLDELLPRVMSSFVRNRLINEVYLPLVGDNLAKQMGAGRTDQMGLLLLVSPPGYGKTTLMEYIANRLGLVFMKVNGPALGHDVHSLDPAEAPNATARQEVEKINLAFEMGNNVMLYLDDIQHTHPELLQKFISLCDGTRRIEGVWRGTTRTYDLRGKKFCVVMAGNPYTESGDRFQIPDMLANRADTYNLGEILEGRDEVFSLSYLENSLTSNPVLAPLAARSQADTYALIRLAQGEEVPASELEHDYSAVELGEIMSVLQKLFVIQQTVLNVNQGYIRSAAQEDAYRTEPPFKLQGSYRNMNKMAEKVVAALNEAELLAMIDDHYQGEAQTLTTGAEANLLKLAGLLDRLDGARAERWTEITEEFRRRKLVGGGEDDPVARVTNVLSALDGRLAGIGDALAGGVSGDLDARVAELGAAMSDVSAAIAARPDLSPGLSGVSAAIAARPDLSPGLSGVSAAIAARPDLSPALSAVGEGIAGVGAAVAGQDLSAEFTALVKGLVGLRTVIAKGYLTEPMGRIATALADSEDELRLDARVYGLSQEVAGVRKALEQAGRGLADLSVLEWLAQEPGKLRTRPDIAEAQRQILLQAQSALGGEPAQGLSDDQLELRNVALAGALPVIQDLFVQVSELAARDLAPEAWERMVASLRARVGEAVVKIAQLETDAPDLTETQSK